MIPDPQEASERRHPLQAILMLSVLTMLPGARSLHAIDQFGRNHGRSFALRRRLNHS
ncbi:MAG: transposase family protein [Phycisphaerae bacterium]|nr:transposase family protein [Phycisphaerae bacterium]